MYIYPGGQDVEPNDIFLLKKFQHGYSIFHLAFQSHMTNIEILRKHNSERLKCRSLYSVR